MIQDLARQIAEDKVLPLRAELDEKEEFSHEIIKHFADSDLLGLNIPEEYDGMGMGVFEQVLATEQVARICCGTAVTFASAGLGAAPILLYGSEEQKKKYLPDVACGRKLTAFALTESTAGSDVSGIQTTAVREGDEYILNGTKQWITNAGEAAIYCVIAVTDRSKGPRGASFFIVEKDDPGLKFGKKEKKMGIRTSTTGELIFNDCHIPVERLISREGMGFIIAMKAFDLSRPGVGSLGVGLSQGALEAAVEFARTRIQFGRPIMAQQAVQHILADMATTIEAGRALVYAAARYIDSGARNISRDSAMAKLFPTDMAMKVTTDAVQVFGGHGYMREYPVEKMMRDAKILQIFEGTNQIQRNIIGQELNKEFGSKKKKR
ncbi:MAG: acyl-CoA dehydrogenase family protein [Deltaproteobacteria bacterium]|nr:acyl-CoA dehydrogenase family protein [Deltaproteobacteria bacterium]